jgi:hypothetical protein
MLAREKEYQYNDENESCFLPEGCGCPFFPHEFSLLNQDNSRTDRASMISGVIGMRGLMGFINLGRQSGYEMLIQQYYSTLLRAIQPISLNTIPRPDWAGDASVRVALDPAAVARVRQPCSRSWQVFVNCVSMLHAE